MWPALGAPIQVHSRQMLDNIQLDNSGRTFWMPELEAVVCWAGSYSSHQFSTVNMALLPKYASNNITSWLEISHVGVLTAEMRGCY